MAITSYDIGDVVRCTGTYTNAAGAAVDPSVVTFRYRKPDGTVVLYTYATDVEVVKSSTGVYYVDVTATASGRWYYRFASTGTGAAGSENQFVVKEPHF